jgi:hypothetical protein
MAASMFTNRHIKWACKDSNLEPSGYEPPALAIELQALASILHAKLRGLLWRDLIKPSAWRGIDFLHVSHNG